MPTHLPWPHPLYLYYPHLHFNKNKLFGIYDMLKAFPLSCQHAENLSFPSFKAHFSNTIFFRYHFRPDALPYISHLDSFSFLSIFIVLLFCGISLFYITCSIVECVFTISNRIARSLRVKTLSNSIFLP